MRHVTAIVTLSSVLGLGLALDAAAQTPRPASPPADRPAPTMERETWKNTHGLFESSTIIGTRVKNAQGKDLGEIDQLLVDPRDGKVTHAVIGVGGLAGVGEKHVIVPWSEVKLTADTGRTDRLVATMDQAMLDRAPRYEKRAMTDRDRTPPAASPRTDRPATSPTTPPPATSR